MRNFNTEFSVSFPSFLVKFLYKSYYLHQVKDIKTNVRSEMRKEQNLYISQDDNKIYAGQLWSIQNHAPLPINLNQEKKKWGGKEA